MVVRRWGCGKENHELLLECGSVSAHTCSVDFFSLSLSLSYFLLTNFLFVFSFLVASSKKKYSSTLILYTWTCEETYLTAWRVLLSCVCQRMCVCVCVMSEFECITVYNFFFVFVFRYIVVSVSNKDQPLLPLLGPRVITHVWGGLSFGGEVFLWVFVVVCRPGFEGY